MGIVYLALSIIFKYSIPSQMYVSSVSLKLSGYHFKMKHHAIVVLHANAKRKWSQQCIFFFFLIATLLGEFGSFHLAQHVILQCQSRTLSQ
jgi:hypothetical protein